jgi:hypothetical protein
MSIFLGVIDPLKRFLHLKMLNSAPKWHKLMPEIPNVWFSCGNSNIRDLRAKYILCVACRPTWDKNMVTIQLIVQEKYNFAEIFMFHPLVAKPSIGSNRNLVLSGVPKELEKQSHPTNSSHSYEWCPFSRQTDGQTDDRMPLNSYLTSSADIVRWAKDVKISGYWIHLLLLRSLYSEHFLPVIPSSAVFGEGFPGIDIDHVSIKGWGNWSKVTCWSQARWSMMRNEPSGIMSSTP